MEALIRQIINRKTPCYFVSPHLDDAVLSCGGLIGELAGKTPVTVITVFTEAGRGTGTLSAKKTIAGSGFPDAQTFYAARRKEDKDTLTHSGVTVKHLGEVEALWRKRRIRPAFLAKVLSVVPELSHLYPTYRLHIASGKVAGGDAETIRRVSRKLKRIIPEGSIVFSPIGIGGHVDHLVTRKAVETVFTPMYWYDQPYHYRQSGEKRPKNGRSVQEFRTARTRKANMAAGYHTQIPLLFPEGEMPVLREFYTTKPS